MAQAAVATALREQGQGSVVRGWRQELDPDGNLEIDFQDFARAAAKLHLADLDTELLFGQDNNLRLLTLEEVTPAEGKVINRFKRWAHEQFKSPAAMFAAFDVAKSGKLTKDQFAAACAAHKFEVTASQVGTIFDCIDYPMIGSIQADDVVFLEVDPKLRAQEHFKVKVYRMDQWKRIAAQEYMDYIRQAKDARQRGAPLSKSRLAPRVWLDRTFEQIPAVACQAKKDREMQAGRNERHSRIVFKKHLCSVFGHEVRALRRALARDGGHTFTQAGLRRYCQTAGVDVNPWDLWRALDRDLDGLVGMEELSVEHAFALASLKTWAQHEPLLGSCAAIWETTEAAAASRAMSGTWFSEKKMLMGVFAETLRRLGWPGLEKANTRRLAFEALDLHGCGVVSRSDLEWADRWRPADWVMADPDPKAWAELKQLLTVKYGHPLRAWRMALDKDDSNHLCWTEFRDACRALGFTRAAAAWRAADVDVSGTITLMEYDKPSAELLRSFKHWAEVQFGSIKHCFKALDTDGSGAVSFTEFKRACYKLNWHGDVQLLFNCLDVENVRGCDEGRALTLSELSFLDAWRRDPTEQELAEEEAAAALPAERSLASTDGRRARPRDLASITARLTTPIGLSLETFRGILASPPPMPKVPEATSSPRVLRRSMSEGRLQAKASKILPDIHQRPHHKRGGHGQRPRRGPVAAAGQAVSSKAAGRAPVCALPAAPGAAGAGPAEPAAAGAEGPGDTGDG